MTHTFPDTTLEEAMLDYPQIRRTCRSSYKQEEGKKISVVFTCFGVVSIPRLVSFPAIPIAFPGTTDGWRLHRGIPNPDSTSWQILVPHLVIGAERFPRGETPSNSSLPTPPPLQNWIRWASCRQTHSSPIVQYNTAVSIS